MRHKASCEYMCIGAVLNRYEEYIDELLDKEDEERKTEKKAVLNSEKSYTRIS